VMDYIYKEMYDCIVNNKTPLYAPLSWSLSFPNNSTFLSPRQTSRNTR
jgi:hypothetical protein